jgi:hypothetical protein
MPQQQLEVTILCSSILGLVGAWVMMDAMRRGKSDGVAFLWGLGTILALIVFLPLWLMVRPRLNRSLPTAPQDNAGQSYAPVTHAGDHQTRVCGHCGKFFTSEGDFCPYCGEAVNEPQEPRDRAI